MMHDTYPRVVATKIQAMSNASTVVSNATVLIMKVVHARNPKRHHPIKAHDASLNDRSRSHTLSRPDPRPLSVSNPYRKLQNA